MKQQIAAIFSALQWRGGAPMQETKYKRRANVPEMLQASQAPATFVASGMAPPPAHGTTLQAGDVIVENLCLRFCQRPCATKNTAMISIKTQSNGGVRDPLCSVLGSQDSFTVWPHSLQSMAIPLIPCKKRGPHGSTIAVVTTVFSGLGHVVAHFPSVVLSKTTSTAQIAYCTRKNSTANPGMYWSVFGQFTAAHMYSWNSPDITNARIPPTWRHAFSLRVANGVKKVLFIK
mmetsp:Transcript_54238/g.129272  ORF Transcript_54238/g.129272 Transcript_54238/m.129272 type:complete len:232 (-) Transcript_54238:808-1503(-)